MKKTLSIALTLSVSAFVLYCSKPKQITPEIFITIQNEVLAGDQSDTAKENAAKKQGFTAKEYDDFEKKIDSDNALKEKVGKLRLEQNKGK
jgi:hypothetical protein